MKILVVAHESEFLGGANRALFAILKYWKENNVCDFDVLLPVNYGSCIDELKKMRINYYIFPYKKVFSEKRNQIQDVLRYFKVEMKFLGNKKSAFKVTKELKENNYDLVYSNTRMTSMGIEVARKLKIPHVMHVREFGNNNTIWGSSNIRYIYKNSKAVISISDALKRYLSKDLKAEKFFVTYDGVSYFHDIEIAEKNKENIDVLLTGRISPAKAQDEAIKAIKILKEKGYNNIILHFAGSMAAGTKYEKLYFDKLKQLIKEYNLDKNVIWHGEVSNMKDLRSNMDIELMCALQETFGWVTVEGMRSGLLVIGGNTGATPEIIKDYETGLIYSQGNEIELAEKIEWAIANKNKVLDIRRQAYRYANSHFTVDKNAMETYAVLERVLE